MSRIHIAEQDAIHDFAAVLAKLDAGEVVTIDRDGDAQPIHLLPHRTVPAKTPAGADATTSPEEHLQYLSEFRNLHPEALDSSPWD